MNERKHPEAGVFTGCILWPTDPVTRCSAAVVPALQHCSTAPSCCSKPCYDAAVHNASMKRLAWQLLCFAPSTTESTKSSGDILTISISCRAAAWYLQFCSGRSCCRPQLQSAVSCFLQYSSATGSGGAAAENCIFYSAALVPAITLSRAEMWSLLPSLSIPIHIMIHLHISSWPWSVVLSKHSLSLQSLCWLW